MGFLAVTLLLVVIVVSYWQFKSAVQDMYDDSDRRVEKYERWIQQRDQQHAAIFRRLVQELKAVVEREDIEAIDRLYQQIQEHDAGRESFIIDAMPPWARELREAGLEVYLPNEIELS